jgi:hypothetical protein
MDQDLLGYLLHTLDPQDHAQVEAYLRTHPEAQTRLEALAHGLEPLGWDRGVEAPAGLADRTLAFVAAKAPHGPDAARQPRAPWVPTRSLVDLAVGGLCLLIILGLGAVWLANITGWRSNREPNPVKMTECRENLRKLYVPLRTYAELHQGRFPNVAGNDAPRNVAAGVYPTLAEGRLLTPDYAIVCPATCGNDPCPRTPDFATMDQAAFKEWAQTMSNSYAYSLGYRSAGQIVNHKLGEDKAASLLPLMADNPPSNVTHGNSVNHGGAGQHVLYADGHVVFATTRQVGYNSDDIYLNRNGHVAAGLDWTDACLASGWVRP